MCIGLKYRPAPFSSVLMSDQRSVWYFGMDVGQYAYVC
jgi:hypothetical protein